MVGLSTGALRVYRNDVQAATSDDAPTDAKQKIAPLECLHEDESFDKRPILQLAVIKEANILVSLSDSYVSLYDLHTYKLQQRLDKTKNATLFAVSSSVTKDDESDIPSLFSRLAVAVKRRLLLWVWQDMELSVQAKELVLPSTIKCITWTSDTKLVIGMDQGFVLVNTETGDMIDIIKPAAAVEATNQTGGTRFGAVNTTGMGYVGLAGWAPKPMAVQLGSGALLLAKDVNTLFVDHDGKAVDRRQIPWHSPPEALNYSYPYLLCLQQSTKGVLDVRNPKTSTLWQSIPVPGATLLHVPQPNISLAHAGKGFLVASERCVWRMVAVDYHAQIDELLKASRFDEALSLLGLLEDTLLKDKAGLVREVQMAKAFSLFQQAQYRPALDLFADAGAPPARVIALYPRAISGPLGTESQGRSSETANEGDADAHDNLLDETHQAILHDTESKEAQPIDHALKQDANVDDHDGHHGIAQGDLKPAVLALCSFLAQSRVQAQKYINTDGTVKVSVVVEQEADALRLPFRNLIPYERGADLLAVKWEEGLHTVACLIDTTLFRAYMHSLPSLAGPLFRLDNFCDPHVVEEKLYASGRYNDLIDFLHGKKFHREALELLEKFGRNDAADEVMHALRGPARIVAYLKNLSPDMIDMIIEFAKWPLQAQPDLGMSIFLADTENAERLPRDKVLRFLKSIDDTLATKYLEHIVLELNDETPDFHQDLVDRYIARLVAALTNLDTNRKGLRTKLENLLRQSQFYNKGKAFRQMPSTSADFFESRAIVLSAMGNHKQALSIYVYQLHDYNKAEVYCNQIFLASQASSASSDGTDAPEASIYATLLGLYLQPPSPHKVVWPPALDLLSKHGARLPASDTLALAPDSLGIHELQSYFLGRLRRDNSLHHNARITASLAAVRRADVDRRLVGISDSTGTSTHAETGGRSRRVVIRDTSHCKVCLRRFGNSAVRVYPNNDIVHYGCAHQTVKD